MRLVHTVMISTLLAGTLFAAVHPAEEKPQDPWKDFSRVHETQPVPEDRRCGLESIRREEAGAILKFLSSDLLNGRETATPGHDIAAEFAATLFSIWGIRPAGDPLAAKPGGMFDPTPAAPSAGRSYFQEIEFKETLSSEGELVVVLQRGKHRETRTFFPDVDYTFLARKNQSISAPVVFAGYGLQEDSLKLDEYRGLDVRGKIVMLITGTPGKGNPESPFSQGRLKEKYHPARPSRHRLSPKVKLARDKGALAVLLVERDPQADGDVAKKVLDSREVDDEKPIVSRERRKLSPIESGESMPWEALPYVRISRELADEILGFDNMSVQTVIEAMETRLVPRSKELSGISVTLNHRAKTQLVRSRNVLGFIEGSDPSLKNEVVVIGAHLDHLGRKGDYIFNGADDNGSGSVAVLEVAEAFARNPRKPKRSILFALWTGEEVGLLGSRHYVSHPTFPLKKTVACLNLDMVSRKWETSRLKMINKAWRLGIPEKAIDEIDTDDLLTLSLDAGSEAVLKAVTESNQYLGTTIYIRRSESKMWGTDHAPFARADIPWIFFFAATTDDYHEPSDSFAKVSLDLIEKVSRLTYLSAFHLADR